MFAASLFEAVFDLFVDLFKRFDAIGGKGGGADGDALDAFFFSQTGDFLDRVGFEPFFGAEDGLEGRADFGFVPAQTFTQQARRFLAFAVIRIALFQIAYRHPVVGADQHFGALVGVSVGALNGLRQRLNIRGILEVGGDHASDGLTFFLHQRLKELVVRGRRGRASVVWVKGKK